MASSEDTTYDSETAVYDGDLCYQDDAPQPPQPNAGVMSKAKVKLNLASKSVEQKIPQGNTIKTAMTGNANFPSPPITMTVYGATIAALTAKNAAYLTLIEQAKTAQDELKIAEALYDTQTTQLGAYAESASGGVAAIIESGGFEVRKTPASLGPLSQVKNLDLAEGKHEGSLKAKWKAAKGAKSYEPQICPDPIVATAWKSLEPTSKTRYTVKDLTPGSKVWMRVRAVGGGPAGPWSDPATRIVP